MIGRDGGRCCVALIRCSDTSGEDNRRNCAEWWKPARSKSVRLVERESELIVAWSVDETDGTRERVVWSRWSWWSGFYLALGDLQCPLSGSLDAASIFRPGFGCALDCQKKAGEGGYGDSRAQAVAWGVII